jgi:putative glycosyltransferase
MDTIPTLSIVSTLYRSEACVGEFCRRSAQVARSLERTFEIVLVNDGSPDRSLTLALELQKEIPELVLVDFSRNFGHHPAILAGLSEARGEEIFLIDSDLEEAPEWLRDFEDKMRSEKADVVFGQQMRRKGRFMEQISGTIFYSLFNLLSATSVPVNFVTARLMTRAYVDALLQYRERELFLGGVFVLAGFRQISIPIVKGSHAVSSYSLARRIALFVNALTSFTTRPLEIIFVIGSFVTLIAFIAVCFILYRGLRGETLVGWASVMVTIWLFGGLTMLALGLIGVYLGKVLIETKQRPSYTVRAIFRAAEALPASESRSRAKQA